MTREKEQLETVDLEQMANKIRFNSLYGFAFTRVVFNDSEVFNKRKHTVTAKILMLLLNQKLNNYRGSDVRGDRQFELSLQND